MTSFRVLLFDIDGTLINAGGSGRRALELALEDEVGAPHQVATRAAWLEGMRLDGMTDRLIVREALEVAGMPFDEPLCDRVLGAYVRHLEREIHGPGYQVLPGVAELLEELAARGSVVALCTGNVVDGARVKLARGGLDRFFDWSDRAICGFAEDGEARERIVVAALARARARLGAELDPAHALIIGDTPRDIQAARFAGCPVLAVATGRHGADELAACGADWAVPTLEAPEARAVLVGG